MHPELARLLAPGVAVRQHGSLQGRRVAQRGKLEVRKVDDIYPKRVGGREDRRVMAPGRVAVQAERPDLRPLGADPRAVVLEVTPHGNGADDGAEIDLADPEIRPEVGADAAAAAGVRRVVSGRISSSTACGWHSARSRRSCHTTSTRGERKPSAVRRHARESTTGAIRRARSWNGGDTGKRSRWSRRVLRRGVADLPFGLRSGTLECRRKTHGRKIPATPEA